jgi:predicted nucleotidyltransferase
MATPNETFPPSLNEIKSRLAPFCQRHGVARLEVFGSLARGEPQRGSDIDLLVTFQPEVHLGWDFSGVAEFESRLLAALAHLTKPGAPTTHAPLSKP